MRDLEPALRRLRERNLYRSRRVVCGAQCAAPVVDGRRMLAFASNDYLALANHPEVVRALQQGANQYGSGSGAAHLITGHSLPHHRLEEELAEFLRRPRVLLFSTGYMANLGVISALLGRRDRLYEDRLVHASLIDGALLSRAELKRYPHADVAALRAMAADAAPELIATDGVFSMDGDIAPIQELAAAARACGAWLMVDDAHGIGVLGREGRGSLDHCGVGLDEVPILVGTLGKAFGTFGAFVAGDEALIETLIQRARSYVYTTALPPAVAEASRAALRILRRGEWRRERLRGLVDRFRAGAAELGFELMPSDSPIQPVMAGSAERALGWSRALDEVGILVSAIRPPTVPEGTARLRVTFSAAHTEEDVDRLHEAMARLPGVDLSSAHESSN